MVMMAVKTEWVENNYYFTIMKKVYKMNMKKENLFI